MHANQFLVCKTSMQTDAKPKCKPMPNHTRNPKPPIGRQDQGAQDQQPGLVRTEPPQEQHGGGGSHGTIQAPGRDRFAIGLLAWFASDLPAMWFSCIQTLTKSLDFSQTFMLGLDGLHNVCSSFA